MTQEEKARAYDEALKKARKFYNEAKENEFFTIMSDYEEIFPELAESEDERIIRLLRELGSLDAAKELYEEFNLSYTDVLYWLEKQKEYKPIPANSVGLKEQKPAEIDEYGIIKKHITYDSLSSEVNKRLKECGWYVTEQKPAEWSERMRKRFFF